MAYLMGIDLGTSSVKVMIMSEEGSIVNVCSESYEVMRQQAGWAEQNPELLWITTSRVIRECVYQSEIFIPDIKGIGFSGQMHGLVLLDCEGKPVRDSIIWMDQRSGKEADFINSQNVYDITLNKAASGFYGSSLMWIRNNEPDSYKKIYKAILPKDYIRYRICGNIATDQTDAAGTILYDLEEKKWSGKVLDIIGVSMDILPEICNSFDQAGTVTSECAELTGLCAGTPVVYGAGDQAMHTLGNGMIHAGDMSVNIGTAGQLSVVMERPFYDKRYRTNTFCHAHPGYWSLTGATLNGGLALKWLKENILKYNSYEDMNQQAEQIPVGSDGLIFLPYLCGERTPHMNPEAKGMFFGLTAGMTDAHMIRAVMEGIVFSLRDCMDIFEQAGIEGTSVISSGGGRRSNILLQMQADILGREVYITDMEEEACTGAAMAAGIGTGIYDNMEQAVRNVVKIKDICIIPDMKNHQLYREKHRRYQLLYEKNKELMYDLL